MAYGRASLATYGTTVQLSADGYPEAKIGGVTIDWATVAAVTTTPVTLANGTVVAVGEKYLPMGTTVVRLTSVVVAGSTIGKYGPFDPAATDGRQTLVANGDNYLLNRDAIASDPKDEYPEAIYGGRVWLARVINAGTGTASLAAGPQLATIKSTFPRLVLFSGN